MKKLSVIITSIFICSALALLYLVPERSLSDGSPYNLTTHNKDKKKILIFSCRGGGGHLAATTAIKEYLEPEFCVGSTLVFANTLQAIDLMHKFYSDKKASVDFYNGLLRKNWHRTLNVISKIGTWYFTLRKHTINKIIEEYLLTHKPDLIISVTPFINNSLLKVAQKLDIPFLLIPTDLDGTKAILGIKNPLYDKFHLGLAYDDPGIHKKIAGAAIDKKHISHIGFPVKKALFAPKNQRITRKVFDIPQDKPVILLMMGSQGSDQLYEFSKQITKLSIPAHIMIVLGKSNHLTQQLQRIRFPKHISHTVLGFTNRIPELMSITDILITKSGGVTVNEAIYGQVPMLLDATSTPLLWEAFHHEFVIKHGIGRLVKRNDDIPRLITKMLDEKEQERIKMNFAMFDKKNPEHEIKLLVRDLITRE